LGAPDVFRKDIPPFAVTDARMAVDMVANNVNAIAYVERSQSIPVCGSR